jgi:hypothetical protein
MWMACQCVSFYGGKSAKSKTIQELATAIVQLSKRLKIVQDKQHTQGLSLHLVQRLVKSRAEGERLWAQFLELVSRSSKMDTPGVRFDPSDRDHDERFIDKICSSVAAGGFCGRFCRDVHRFNDTCGWQYGKMVDGGHI